VLREHLAVRGKKQLDKVHNDQINSTSTSNVIGVMSCAGQAARMGDGRMCTKFWLDARSWRNRLEYVHRKEHNIKVNHKELG
jgi:hypothetical protein